MSDRRSTQDTVCLAVDLGWLLAELYDSRRLPGPPPDGSERPLPPHLPGIGAMTRYEKACGLAAHVGADLAGLETALGLGMPTAKTIQAVLDTPGHARDDVRRAVHDLYLDIRNRLAGSDPPAAVAFGLGRLLADTYRIANALAWLDDLDARLPARSASAVRSSLRRWQRWVGGHGGHGDPAPAGEATIRALRQQGCVWRRLLTGQQAADQLLDGRAYVGAAASLLANGRRLAFHYVWKWSWAILAAVVAVGAAVWAALTYAPAGTDRVVAVVVSAAGFASLSWAGVRATLGRAVRQAEHAMWDAEVVAAIGKAATIIPDHGESAGQAGQDLLQPGQRGRDPGQGARVR